MTAVQVSIRLSQGRTSVGSLLEIIGRAVIRGLSSIRRALYSFSELQFLLHGNELTYRVDRLNISAICCARKKLVRTKGRTVFKRQMSNAGNTFFQ